MSAIKHPMSNRKLSFGVVLAVAVFAFLTLVPFEYQQTVGYQATYAGISPAVSFDLDRLESALSALGYDDADYGLHATTDGTVCKVSGLPSRHAVREVTAAMVSLADFQGEPEVTPMIETVSGSLYAQVKCEIGSLDDFDMEGMTDEEVTTEIKKRLAEQGCYDADVQVNSKTAADGKESRQICVKMADDGSAASSTVCSVGFLENCGIDDKNKTDAEVEEEIRKRCEANGNSDVEVSVTTRADGKRRIEMKCKPADN